MRHFSVWPDFLLAIPGSWVGRYARAVKYRCKERASRSLAGKRRGQEVVSGPKVNKAGTPRDVWCRGGPIFSLRRGVILKLDVLFGADLPGSIYMRRKSSNWCLQDTP